MANQIQNEHNFRNVLGKYKYNLKQNLFIGKIPKLKFIALNLISINFWHDQLSRVDISLLCDDCVWSKMNIYKKEILKKIPNLITLIPKNCLFLLELRINSFLNVLGNFLVHFNHFDYLSFDNFNNYWNNIYFTQQGTINYVKTASQLIDNTFLSTEEKFVLACKNCFEEKIRNLLKILPEDIIEKFNNENHCLIWYWTRYMKGEFDRFGTFEQGFDYWDHLIVTSICEEDYVAVQYFWERKSEEKLHHLNFYMISNLENNGNIDICLYLFQQINENNLLILEVNIIKLLLSKLYIVSQQDVVPRIETYILDLIKKLNVFDAFEILLFGWNNKMIRDYDYVTLWAELAKHFKYDIEKNFTKFSTKFLFSCILKRNDILSFKLLLRNCSSSNYKILDGKNGIKYCVALITIGGFVLLDEYLNYILEEKEELISEWKKYIFEEGILELCVKLIIYGKSQSINTFLKNYVPEDQISEFKKNLPLKNNADFIRCFSDLFEFVDFNFLGKVYDFLFWCFEGNKEEIELFRLRVFKIDSDLYNDKRDIFFTVLKELTTECKWELVNQYGKWIYFVPKDIGGTPFEKLTRIKKILGLIFISEPNDPPRYHLIPYTKLLMSLITSCFKPNEVEELKEELDRGNFFLNLVRMLIEYTTKYEMCNELLLWRFSSDKEKVNIFKRTFMLSSGCNYLYTFLKSSSTTHKIRLLLEWFNPSRKSRGLFKDGFNKYVVKHKEFLRKMYYILFKNDDEFDEFMISRNKGIAKCLKIIEEMLGSKSKWPSFQANVSLTKLT